jgi:hypothetical protein
MPDSLPPNWGPAPYDERDLDAVLSGATADIPVTLRPVADTLAALRAAAAPAELSGQATIMAEFRALGLGEAARAADPAMTPQLPADRPRRRTARHRGRRGRRRAASRVSLRARALMGAAAAAAIVVAVAFTGNLPGPIQHLPHFAHPASNASPGLQVQSAATESARPKPSHHATASPVPVSSSSPSPSSPSPSSDRGRLCRALSGDSNHQGAADWRAEVSLLQELSKLAGGSDHVSGYCSPYVGDLFPHGFPGTSGYNRGTSAGDGAHGNQAQPGEPAQPGPGGNLGQNLGLGAGNSGAGHGSWGSSGTGW